jgi:ligand-binding sensor domain-containing protein
MVALLTLIVLLFPHTKALASDHNINQNPLKFERISIAEGLSQSYVYDITQDQNGFIWIATQDGLNRYDGKNFVYYRHDSTDKSSIANNFIRKLFIDKQNVLWVGTNKGLSRYNESLDNFDNFYHENSDSNSLKDNEIWDIYQDNNNDIWVSTKEGLHKFDLENNNFSRIRIRGFDLALKEIKTIFQDNRGNFWLGTYDKGIYLANSALTFMVPLSGENKWNLSLNATSLYDLKVIDNQYWLATDNGVFVVSQNYKVSKHYSANSEILDDRLLSNNVRTISLLDNSMVWLGTLNGLNIINLLSGGIDAYQAQQHENALSNNYILKLFKDSADNIWIGTDGNGINTFNSLQLKIKHGLFSYNEIPSAVYAFAESKDGKVWFATDDGKLSYLNSNENIVNLILFLI